MGAPRRPDDILDDVDDDDEAPMQRNSPSTGLPAHLLPPDFLADMPPYIAQIVQQKPHLVEQILASHQQNQKQKQASGIMELPYSDLPPPPPPLPPPPHVAMQSPKDDDDDNNGSGSGGSDERDKMGTGLGTDLLRVARSHSSRTRKNGDDCYEDYGEEERSDGETTELLRHCRRRPRSTTVPPTASRISNTTATTTTTTSAPSSASKLLLPGGDKMFYKSTV
ncbi:hypothetical protein ACA910_020321 [Epithemia clementina (nom. ined.)]